MFFLIGCSNNYENRDASIKTDLSVYRLNEYEKDAENLRNKKLYDDDVLVGFAVKTTKEPIWKKHKEFFISKAEELGAQVIFKQADNDVNNQISQIDELVAKGVDVLVIGATDGEAISESVQKAKESGVKVIAYDQIIKNVDIDLFVSLDNYKVGEYQGKFIKDNVKEGNVIYIGGAPTDSNAIIFRDEAMKIINENSNINIIFNELTPNWDGEVAYENVNNVLSRTTDIKAVLTANDGTAGGAIAALKNYELDGRVIVTGLDAELIACQRIVEGSQTMTVYKPANKIAENAAEFAVKLAKNEKIATDKTVYNGKINVPVFYVQPQVITKENMMDTIIKDNYYSYEEVYKNLPENDRPKK